jgi:methionyl aminopeptidase
MAKIKTKEDIELLREAGRRLAAILRVAGEQAKSGVAVKDLDTLVHQLITAGGDMPAFLNYKPAGARRPYPASLCVSVNDAAVHGIPTESDYILADGDIVSLDAGLTHQGLIADMCITVPVGTVDERGMQLIAAAKRALDAGIAVVRAGARLGDIGAAIEGALADTGFAVVEDLGGHGVGHSVHEPPHIFHFGTQGTGAVLEEGMAITIEPTVSEGSTDIILDRDDYTYRTADGSRTAQFEHTMVVTKDGCEIITKE